MKATIRKAKKSDADSIHTLIEELAVFEKAAGEVIVSVSQIGKDGVGAKTLFECFVAEIDEDVVGMAIV